MSVKRYYIAGPMRGRYLYNFPKFEYWEELLRNQGHEVVSPAAMDMKDGFDPRSLPPDHNFDKEPEGMDFEAIMIRDLSAMSTCSHIFMLAEWDRSEGARREHEYAWKNGMVIEYEDYNLPAEDTLTTANDMKSVDTIGGFGFYGSVAKWQKDTDNGKMRQYATGALRDTAMDKLDYEGFLCPMVLERYAQYMHKHRKMADGSLRESDNWQKGIPIDDYMKSKWRHMFETWSIHRRVKDGDITESLCAELFNTMGMLHELLTEPSGD